VFFETIFMLLLGLAITLILIAVALLFIALEQRRQWIERWSVSNIEISLPVKSIDTIFREFERRLTIKFGSMWAVVVVLMLIAMRYML
jgi:hypothetical protein